MLLGRLALQRCELLFLRLVLLNKLDNDLGELGISRGHTYAIECRLKRLQDIFHGPFHENPTDEAETCTFRFFFVYVGKCFDNKTVVTLDSLNNLPMLICITFNLADLFRNGLQLAATFLD